MSNEAPKAWPVEKPPHLASPARPLRSTDDPSPRIVKRVMMLPYFPQNPYQVLLRKALLDEGIETVPEKTTWRLTRKVKELEADAVHFHWLHPWTARTKPLRYKLERPLWLWQLRALKRKGVKLVWTVHNLKDHENRAPAMDRDFCRLMADQCDRLICHSEFAAEEAGRYYGIDNGKIEVIPHGNYVDWYPNTITKATARAELGIPVSAPVMIAFGEIRPYKNSVELIRAFKQGAPSEAFLLVIGRCKEQYHKTEILDAIGNDERIRTCLEFIADEAVQTYMNAADIAALPYRDILTSGAAVLAMSFGLPILAPRLPFFEEMPGEEGAVLYGTGDDALATAINEALSTPDVIKRKSEFNARLAEQLNWRPLARKTSRLYGDYVKSSSIS